MSTVGEAVEMLNETHLHPQGFHLFFVRDELIDDGSGDGDPPYTLMRQTYDWRFDRPDKPEYTVTLSAADMEYIGKAMEVYHEACYTRHLEPALRRLIKSLGECESNS